LALSAEVLGGLGLEVHPDKTRVVGLGRGEGFDFLGFHHQMVATRRWRGRRYLQTWPSAKAMKRARARVRQITSRHMLFVGLEDTVADLNRFLRGWSGYFRHGNSGQKFAGLDRYVHLRLARYEMLRHGRAWLGLDDALPAPVAPSDRGLSPERDRPLGSGACRPVKDMVEPCDRKGHARFFGGALETGQPGGSSAGPGPVCYGTPPRWPGRDPTLRSLATAPALYPATPTAPHQRPDE
jgi:hypothetical protein